MDPTTPPEATSFEQWASQQIKEAAYLDKNFKYHPPTPEQQVKYEALRASFKAIAAQILSLCPDSRERSAALTNLEQSQFWANSSIARNG